MSGVEGQRRTELAFMSTALKHWHRLVESNNPAGLTELLAEDVVFYSPVVHTPQHGKAIALKYLTAAFGVLFNGSFRYVREIVGERDALLEFELELDGIAVNGIDLISWNSAGQITEFKVMVRPRKGLEAVANSMFTQLTKTQ